MNFRASPFLSSTHALKALATYALLLLGACGGNAGPTTPSPDFQSPVTLSGAYELQVTAGSNCVGSLSVLSTAAVVEAVQGNYNVVFRAVKGGEHVFELDVQSLDGGRTYFGTSGGLLRLGNGYAYELSGFWQGPVNRTSSGRSDFSGRFEGDWSYYEENILGDDRTWPYDYFYEECNSSTHQFRLRPL